MGPWARRLATLAALLLLAPSPTLASDTDDDPAELADPDAESDEKPEEESDEMLKHTDEEWAIMKKEMLDSLPDDENETDDDGPDEDARWHITAGYPFIEYEGFLDADEKRDLSKMNLHSGKMSLTEAKNWCAHTQECVGFNHAGDPGEGPHEFFFKDYWKLSVETEDPWTSYQKGEKLEDEAPSADDEGEHEEITAEKIMEEYGVDMEKFHAENKIRETDRDSGNHKVTHLEM